MEGMGKQVDKQLIYLPMRFVMGTQFLLMRHKCNFEKHQRGRS